MAHCGAKDVEGGERAHLGRGVGVVKRNVYRSERHACGHLAKCARTRLNEETNGKSS